MAVRRLTFRGITWAPESRCRRAAAALLKAAVPGLRGKLRVQVNWSDTTVTVTAPEAAWLHGGAVLVAAAPSAVTVVAGIDAAVAIAGEVVRVPAGGAVTVAVPAGPVAVAAATPRGCLPVLVYNGRYADALLELPGTNLCVPEGRTAAWSDAVLVGPRGAFVCTHCWREFPALAAINDHFSVKLQSAKYTSLAPAVAAAIPTSSPAATCTQPPTPAPKRARHEAPRVPPRG